MRHLNKDLIITSVVGFIVVVITLVSLISSYSYQEQKSVYQAQAQHLYQSLLGTALTNKVILEGFASIADEVDEFPYYETLSRYTDQVKYDYPHIYMLELQQRVVKDKLSSFEQSFKQAGYQHFKVKTFSYDDSREWGLAEDNPQYFPVTFMSPFNPEAKEVMGLDILSVPFLTTALKRALASTDVIASKPFDLAEGGRSYVLFKRLKKHKDIVASVLIDTNELIKYLERQQHDAFISLQYPDGEGQWSTETTTSLHNEEHIFGRYQFNYRFDELGQPFRLKVEYPIKITDFKPVISLFMCLLSLGILILVGRSQLTAMRLKYDLKQTNQALQKHIKQKERLFANISHELRTPLTLISAPLDNLFEDGTLSVSQRGMVELAKHNSERLYALTNQVIALSSADSKPKMIENVVVDDIAVRLKIAFESLFSASHVNFQCDFNSLASINTDLADFSSVLENLLSNALKYTDNNGQVHFSTAIDNHRLLIRIENSHVGLSSQQLASMFERFERLSVSDSHQGFGLGLAIVKEICLHNDWDISCDSAAGVVRFELSISQWSVLKDNTSPALRQLKTLASVGKLMVNKNSILIVEDNDELRQFLVDLLSSNYLVLSASNGAEGIAIATEQVPDLVISDFMMPKCSGFELVETLNNQDSTSHIPVILLTARTEKRHELKGLELGAVDYITKPFVAKELIFKIDNIMSRQLPLATAQGNIEKITVISERDKAFCGRLEAILASYYFDANFNVEQLVSKVALSERQLQRKLRALYQKTPAEYIRYYRIDRAKELLLTGRSISLTANDVGFNSASYFSTTFKTVTGHTPKKYLNELTTS